MNSEARDDHAKFVHALVARDLRRLTAMLKEVTVDDEPRTRIDAVLMQLEVRLRLAFFHDPVDGTLTQDQDTYADRRPVTTTIGWGDGYATLVHCPDPADGTSGSATYELSEEVWPGG